MRRIILFLFVIFNYAAAADDNVAFLQAVPNFTTLAPMEVVTDFAIDAQNHYYFLDSKNKKIYIYDANSNLLNTINLTSFQNPAAIQLSHGNDIYVLDRDSKKVVLINPEGKELLSFGNTSDYPGGFSDPFSLDSDEFGNLFILDAQRNQLLKFNPDGLFRGNFTVENPIALTVDKEQIIHVLNRDDNGGFSIINISESMSYLDEIKILNAFSPVDISVNNFGEYYIVDEEAGKVIRYGKYGNVIGDPIGKKSSSKGRGQFADPLKVICTYLNNETENISILDSKFSLSQSFKITTLHERSKLKEKTPFLPVAKSTTLSLTGYTGYACDNGYDFYIIGKSISVFSESKELFVINDPGLDEISYVIKCGDLIAVADNGSKKIYLFDSANGQIKGELQNSFSQIEGLVSDSKKNIYVLDDNDILIFNSAGNRTGSFKEMGILFSHQVKSFSISGDEVLCLKLNEDNYYFEYDLAGKKYQQIKIHKSDFDQMESPFLITTNGITALYNKETGVVEIYKDGIQVDRFLSRGSGEQMLSVAKMFFDRQTSELVLANQSVVQKYKLTLPSGYNLRLGIDELGFAKLEWDSNKSGANRYNVYRRENGNQDFQLVSEVHETSFTILEEVTNTYEYAVRAVSNQNTEGMFSNIVKDGYTFARSIRFNRPEEAIDILNQYRDVSSSAVDNQILSIYNELVNKYKQDKKYELALRNISKMKSINPNNFAYYVERSEILEKMQRISDAVEELNIAREKFPNNINIDYYLIRLYKKQNDYRSVLKVANDALTQFAGDERILDAIADAYYQLKLFNEAARYYRVLYQQTGNLDYNIQAGRILVAQKKFTEAFALYNQLKSSGKANGVLYSAMAEAYMEQGENTKAVSEINNGLKLEPDNADLYFLLGKIQIKLGDKKSGQKAFEKAVELDDSRAEFNIALADLLSEQGKKEDAVYYYETAVLYSPENVDALLKLGSIYLEENKVDYAYRHLSKAYRLAPSNNEVATKYNSVRDKRSQLNSSREPVEFNYINLGEVDLRNFENFNPSNFGSVTLFNTRNEPITDILVQIECPDLISIPILMTIPLLQPNEFNENYFDLKPDEELIAKLNGKSPLKITFNMTYNYQGTKKALNREEFIVVKY